MYHTYICIENIYMTSGPPTITLVQLTKPDTAYITWSHNIPIPQDQLSYMIVYKNVLTSDIEYVSCDNHTSCEVNGLLYGSTYSIVIAPGDHINVFQPTAPLNISITGKAISMYCTMKLCIGIVSSILTYSTLHL